MMLSDLIRGLGLARVAGPFVPDRPIRWAHTTELLSPGRYLRGGELVLTVGSALTSPETCVGFVADLASAGVAAVGFGVGDVHDTVPEPMRRACDEYGVPLVAVPPTIPFQTLTELLAEQRIAARLAGRQRTAHLVATVLDALATQGSDVDVLGILAEQLGGHLCITAQGGLTETAAGDPEAGGAPVVVDLPGDPPGRLWWRPPQVLDPLLDGALPDLAPALALWRRQRDAATRAGEADLGRLLRLVLDGQAEPAVLHDPLAAQLTSGSAWPGMTWGRGADTPGRTGSVPDLSGLTPLHAADAPTSLATVPRSGASARTVVADAAGKRRSVTATAWRAMDAPRVRVELAGAPRAALDNALVVFTAAPEVAVAFAAAAGLPCGVGDPSPLDDVTRSVREALEALSLSCRRGTPVTAHDLATLDALLDQVPGELVRPFVDQLLVPLAQHDQATGGHLLVTLQAFIDGGASVVPVARRLYLHPNTLRHRLHRIADLTGRDPLQLGDRTGFVVALKVAARHRLPRQVTTRRTRDAAPHLPGSA